MTRTILDLAKPKTTVFDLSNVLNPRVNDDLAKISFHIQYDNKPFNMTGYKMYFISADENMGYINVDGMVDKVEYGDNVGNGDVTFKFPANVFKKAGTFDSSKTMFVIENINSNYIQSTINVSLTVLENGVAKFNADVDQIGYDSELEQIHEQYKNKAKELLDELINQVQTANNFSDVKETAEQAKQTANDSIAKANAVNNEVITARSRFSNLNDRLNNQDIKINAAETTTNANANYNRLAEKDLSQDEMISTKADKNEIEKKLSQMSLVPEAFDNIEALKSKYPNGKTGIFITVDTGHQWYWVDGSWKDGGIYQSEGNVEVQRMRTPTNSITSEVFDSADKAVNTQLAYLNYKINSSSNLKPQYIYPYKKEDYLYDKKDKIDKSTCDSYFFEVDYDYLQSFTIETNTEQYSNVCAFLDKNGTVISYIRKTSSDDSTTRVSVQKPVGAEALVVTTKNDYTKFSVQAIVSNFPTGWFRNGSLANDYYAPNGLNRLIVNYDTTNKDVIFTPKDNFEVYDNVQKKWVATPILLNSGLSEDSIQVRKNDNSIIKSRDINGHFDIDYVIHDSYIPNDVGNGLTDITNTFKSYQVGTIMIGTDNEIVFNTNVPNKWNNGWYSPETDEQLLFDIKPGYQLYFLECIQKDGKYYYSQAYKAWNPNQNNFATGKQYFNLYADHSYIWVVKKDDETQFSPFSIKPNVNIYKVDIDKHIPDYYKGYLTNKISSINDSNSAVGDFSTLFITDIHAEHNTKHSIPLVKQVMNQCSIRLALGGGDWATAWFSSEDVEEQHRELKQRFIDLRTRLKDIPMLKTIGNHEWAYGSNNGYNIAIDELYRYYLKDDADKLTGIVYGEDGTYSYYDDTQDKCRYISVNVSDYPTVTIPTGHADNKEWYFAVSDKQKTFITNALKSVPGDDWNVIIESHLVPLDKDQMTQIPAEDIGTVISNGDELRKIAENYVAKTGDFTQAKGTLIAWLGGHYHRDDITTLNGVTYVTTNGDCIIQAKGAQERVVNSTSEQCFDVFSINRKTRKVNIFRIGAGDNREFNY